MDTPFPLGGGMGRPVVGGSQSSWGRKKPQRGAQQQNSWEGQNLFAGDGKKVCRKNGVKLEELKTLFPPSSLHSGLPPQEKQLDQLENKK